MPLEKLALLQLLQASKSFAGRNVLVDITLSLYAQETVAIVGPNGSGKSTLLRIISGISPVTSGSRNVGVEQLKIGYVPDRFPKLRFTPQEYLSHMGRIQAIPANKLGKRIHDLLALFYLGHAGNQQMTGFSKGMLQKVNIMQAVLEQPDLLLLDEPLSGLDQDSQRELISLLLELKLQGIAIVVVSHEKLLLETVADRILTLGMGGVVADSSFDNQAMDVVVIQVRLGPFADGSVLKGHPAIVDYQILDGVTNLSVRSNRSDDVLRSLLEIGGSIVSLNPVRVGDELLHFRNGQSKLDKEAFHR